MENTKIPINRIIGNDSKEHIIFNLFFFIVVHLG